jgi:Dynamin central region
VLSATLSTELIRTIRTKLPNLTSNIQGNIATLQQELYALGEDMPEGRGAMVHAIIELCGKVQEEYKQIINHVRPPLPRTSVRALRARRMCTWTSSVCGCVKSSLERFTMRTHQAEMTLWATHELAR